jgi:ATPase subunit of ABC transporter with duplicated ATPase domains
VNLPSIPTNFYSTTTTKIYPEEGQCYLFAFPRAGKQQGGEFPCLVTQVTQTKKAQNNKVFHLQFIDPSDEQLLSLKETKETPNDEMMTLITAPSKIQNIKARVKEIQEKQEKEKEEKEKEKEKEKKKEKEKEKEKKRKKKEKEEKEKEKEKERKRSQKEKPTKTKASEDEDFEVSSPAKKKRKTTSPTSPKETPSKFCLTKPKAGSYDPTDAEKADDQVILIHHLSSGVQLPKVVDPWQSIYSESIQGRT